MWEVELAKIKENVDNLKQISEELKSNEQFMLEAIKINSFAVTHASPVLKNKESFALDVIKIDSHTYKLIDEWQDSEKATRLAVSINSELYFYAAEKYKNENFKNSALKSNSWYPLIKLNKVLKNNFSEALADTFAIMYGNYGIKERLYEGELDPNQLKYGLIDISLIPQLSNFLINYGLPSKLASNNPFIHIRDNEQWESQRALRNISCVLGFSLQFLRLGMAASATVIVFPVVVLVQLLKFPYIYYHEKKLLQLEGEICHDNASVSDKTTLGNFMSRTKSSLNDLCGQSSKITSCSAENLEEHSHGPFKSISSRLFFKPSESTTSAQAAAKRLVTAFGVDEEFDPNDIKSAAIGRSFW